METTRARKARVHIDMLNTSNKTPSHKTGQPQVPCQYCGSTEHCSYSCSQHVPHEKLRIIVNSTYDHCWRMLQRTKKGL